MVPAFWFAVAIIIFTILVFIVSVVNAIYYYRLSNSPLLATVSSSAAVTSNTVTLPITANEATTLLWVNVIWAVLALVGLGGAGYIAYYYSRPVPTINPAYAALLKPTLPLAAPSDCYSGMCGINQSARNDVLAF